MCNRFIYSLSIGRTSNPDSFVKPASSYRIFLIRTRDDSAVEDYCASSRLCWCQDGRQVRRPLNNSGQGSFIVILTEKYSTDPLRMSGARLRRTQTLSLRRFHSAALMGVAGSTCFASPLSICAWLCPPPRDFLFRSLKGQVAKGVPKDSAVEEVGGGLPDQRSQRLWRYSCTGRDLVKQTSTHLAWKGSET